MIALRQLVLVSGILFSSLAWSVTVTYTAEDIADVGSDDLWTYRYLISGDLPALDSLRIAFASDLHSPLAVDGAVDDWYAEFGESQTTPFPADGYVLFSRVTGDAPLPKSFDVTVARFAAGPVAAQTFEVLGKTFDLVDSGVTTSPIPEPTTNLLLAGGLTLVVLRRLRIRR